MSFLIDWLNALRMPLLMGAVSGMLPFLFAMPALGDDKPGGIFLSAIASVAAVITGFTGASISVLLGGNNILVKKLQRAGGFADLMHFLRAIFALALVLIFTALVGFLSWGGKAGVMVYHYPVYPHVLFCCLGLLAGMFIKTFNFLVQIGIYEGDELYKEHRLKREKNVLHPNSHREEAEKLLPKATNEADEAFAKK